MTGYTAYILKDKERDALLDIFEPQFKNIIAHHITNEFNVCASTPIPELKSVEITHHISDGHGIECLVFRINGESKSRDGRYYHMTWSIDADQKPLSYILNVEADITTYKPKHSNLLIERAFDQGDTNVLIIQELECKIPASSFIPKYIPS